MVKAAEKRRTAGIPASMNQGETLRRPLAVTYSAFIVSRHRRRPILSAIKSLWPLALAVLLLAATVGFFWLVAHEVRFERRALPEETSSHLKK